MNTLEYLKEKKYHDLRIGEDTVLCLSVLNSGMGEKAACMTELNSQNKKAGSGKWNGCRHD